MEKSMYFDYQEISNRMLNNKSFHRDLMKHIENSRETELEKAFPDFKIGQIIYPGIYLEHKNIKKYVSEIVELDDIFQNLILPGIKFNFNEFIKN